MGHSSQSQSDQSDYSTKPPPRRRRFLRRRRRTVSPSPSVSLTPTNNSNSSDQEPLSSNSSNPDPSLSANSPHSLSPPSSIPSSPLTPPTYINVAPLPIFHGDPDECPVTHLSRFDTVCRANNALSPAIAARIFPVSLDSYAALWYELSIDPHLPWPEIRSAFLLAFRPPGFVNRARAELFSLHQSDGESVNRYHLRMQWILKRWPEHGMSDEILRGIFVDGLRVELKEWVSPQRPASLHEAVRLAVSWEQAEGVREARRKALKEVINLNI